MPHRTTPAWVDRFHALVRRLSDTEQGGAFILDRGRTLPPGNPPSTDIDEEEDDLFGTPVPEDVFHDLDDTDLGELPAPPTAPRPRRPVTPRPVPDLPLLLAALHFARAFTPRETAALFAPAALTVIHVGPAAALEPMGTLLSYAVVPRGRAIDRIGRARAPGTVILLHPSGTGHSEVRHLADSLTDALALPHPCLVLLADGIDLPPALAAVLPPARTLPPLDGAGLRALLAARFPAHTRRALAGATRVLPADAALGALTLPALSCAFREPTPPLVVAALHRLAAARRPRGVARAAAGDPDLALFDPAQPAVQVARRALGDLALWRAGKLGWADVPNGLLLAGPPGTGKTWLARATAAAGHLPLVTGTIAEWQRANTLGPMLAAMEETFADARAHAPCLLFIDEIDAVGTRFERTHNSNYDDKVIAAFLTAIDEIRQVEGVILMGATNRIEGIDPAVIRAGRFDRKVALDRPTLDGLTVMLTGLLRADGIPAAQITELARAGLGLSPAELATALRTARATARAAGAPLTAERVRQALGKGTHMTSALAWRMAVHEAGHAVIAARLGFALDRISLGTGGAFVEWHRPVQPGTRAAHAGTIALLLGGRAAEEFILGEASSGAGGSATSDLAHATTLASALEARLGLGESGLAWNPATLATLLADPEHSARVNAHLAAGEAKARAIITALRPVVEALARALLAAREIAGADLVAWIDLIRAAKDGEPESVPAMVPEETEVDLLQHLADMPIG